MRRRAGLPTAAAAVITAATLVAGALASAAAATSTPPPTPVGKEASPSPFPTVLQTPRPVVPRPPGIAARRAVLVDQATGQILYGKEATRRQPIASLTKMMTALIVLGKTNAADVVTVSRTAALTPPSDMGLVEDERITVHDLLEGLLLSSANDAAVALGQHVAGSVPAFVAMMNRRAAALGMRHSHFASPNGLDDRGYSTPRDLATLARAAMAMPGFRRLVATKFADLPGPPPKKGKPQPDRHLQNRNVLLWLYRGATGVKTGFTQGAGWCLVATAARRGRHLVAVVLDEPSQGASFSNAAALLNYGFAEFQESDLAVPGETEGTVLLQGEPVLVSATEPLTALVRRDRLDDIRSTFVPAPGVALPVHHGQRVGSLLFRTGALRLGAVPLMADESVDAPPASPGTVAQAPPPAELAPAFDSAVRLLHAVARSAWGSLL
jgi:serine-type D-Ala-D-Ala carboxypeptidase (penicillin-binding protein 5/6)